jgi:hypothetical protein
MPSSAYGPQRFSLLYTRITLSASIPQRGDSPSLKRVMLLMNLGNIQGPRVGQSLDVGSSIPTVGCSFPSVQGFKARELPMVGRPAFQIGQSDHKKLIDSACNQLKNMELRSSRAKLGSSLFPRERSLGWPGGSRAKRCPGSGPLPASRVSAPPNAAWHPKPSSLWSPVPPTLHPILPGAAPEPPRSTSDSNQRYYGEAPVGLRRCPGVYLMLIA